MNKLESIYVLTREEQDEPSTVVYGSRDINKLKDKFVPKTFGGKEITWTQTSFVESESSCGRYKITKVKII